MTLSTSDRAKLAAAARALEMVEDGMRLGLGSGSTAAWFVQLLARRVRHEGLRVTGVPTSQATAGLAIELGLELAELDALRRLDLTVDGADEFDAGLNLIKGGGAALLREKIVAAASDRMVVVADEGKRVARLGAFPLPVEVVCFGWQATRDAVEEMLDRAAVATKRVILREQGGAPLVTDEGHHLLDLHLGRIDDPVALAAALNGVPGVVENGLFLGMAELVVLGASDGRTEVLGRDGAVDATRRLVDVEGLVRAIAAEAEER
jgi:ribose 5-phosphate isomerase A